MLQGMHYSVGMVTAGSVTFTVVMVTESLVTRGGRRRGRRVEPNGPFAPGAPRTLPLIRMSRIRLPPVTMGTRMVAMVIVSVTTTTTTAGATIGFMDSPGVGINYSFSYLRNEDGGFVGGDAERTLDIDLLFAEILVHEEVDDGAGEGELQPGIFRHGDAQSHVYSVRRAVEGSNTCPLDGVTGSLVSAVTCCSLRNVLHFASAE